LENKEFVELNANPGQGQLPLQEAGLSAWKDPSGFV
jgi:hypothetical protein